MLARVSIHQVLWLFNSVLALHLLLPLTSCMNQTRLLLTTRRYGWRKAGASRADDVILLQPVSFYPWSAASNIVERHLRVKLCRPFASHSLRFLRRFAAGFRRDSDGVVLGLGGVSLGTGGIAAYCIPSATVWMYCVWYFPKFVPALFRVMTITRSFTGSTIRSALEAAPWP